jgi:Zn-dependent protease with chaperone function
MTTTVRPDDGSRVSVLDVPAPVGGRYGVLLTAIVATALFAATFSYTASSGVPWAADLVRCRAATCALSPSALLLLPVAAVVVLVGGAGLVLWVAPAVIAARRRLRPVEARFPQAAARVAALGREMRVRSVPSLVGGPDLRDAFCFGRPGRVWIGVPTALLIRPGTPVFEAVIRHELAHVEQGDVALAWLARSAWWVLTPLLALPVLLGVTSGHVGLVPDYLWRAVLFAAVVLLVQRELLRAREHQADLQAARSMGGSAALLDVLPAGRVGWARRWRSWHPDGWTRRLVLLQPSRIARVGFGEAVGVGFLGALALTLVGDVWRSLSAGASVPGLSGSVVGLLVGATVGTGLYRLAAASGRAVTGRDLHPAVGGLLVGALAGQAISFVAVGTAGVGPFGNLVLLLVVACAMAGAATVTAGLATLAVCADAVPRRGRQWAVVAVLGALVFGAALSTAAPLADALATGGWPTVNTLVMRVLTGSPTALLAILLAGVAAWCTRRPGPGPAPLPLPAALWCGLCAGVPAALVVAVGDVVDAASTAGELVRQVDLVWWVAAAAGSTSAVALRLRHGPRGLGAGLLSSVVATLVTAAGYLIPISVQRGLDASGLWSFVAHPLALGLLLTIAVAAVPVPQLSGRRTPALAAVTGGLVAACLVLALGSSIVPRSVYNDADDASDLAGYGHTTAFDLRKRFATIFASMVAIDRGTDPLATKIQRLDRDVAAPLDQLIREEQQYQAPDAQVAALQGQGVSTLVAVRASVTEWRTALADNSAAELHTANQHFLTAIHRYEAWSAQFGA